MSDEKNEPISAKLRRWADPDKSGAAMNCFASRELGINCGEMICDECEREVFRRIADEIDREIEAVKALYAHSLHPMFGKAVVRALAEGVGAGDFAWLKDAIERYYLPRPLFEDGEPVQASDIEEIGGLSTCCVYTDGSWKFDPDEHEDERNPKQWIKQTGWKDDRVKRPKQQVLDADGVPIEVGDVLYRTTDGMKVTVAKLEKGHFVDGDGVGCNPPYFTHREPESLKKLLNDIRRYLAESPCIDVHVRPWEQRLTALIEQDGRDA